MLTNLLYDLSQELSRALKRDSKAEKASSSTTTAVVTSEDTSVVKNRRPSKEDADAEEYYGTPAKDFAGLFPNERYPLPPPPPLTMPPNAMNGRNYNSSTPSTPEKKEVYRSVPTSHANTPSKSSKSLPFNGPRVDRAKKPDRFKSAHERLFGKKEDDDNHGEYTPNGSKRDSNRDSMASPEYMNSSSFTVPPPPTTTTTTISFTPYSARNVTSFTNHDQPMVSTLSSDHSSSNSATPYQRTKYQSFLSDLIRTQKDPPPPPPKPSSMVSVASNAYQPIYGSHAQRLSSRLSAGTSSSASGYPFPPPSPPKSILTNSSTSNSIWREAESHATYATAIPQSCRPQRLPPPSAQDLLSRR